MMKLILVLELELVQLGQQLDAQLSQFGLQDKPTLPTIELFTTERDGS